MMWTAIDREDRQQRAGGVWDYVSVSRLNLWLKCPLAFKLRYIDGIDSPASPSQFLGRRVHAALEYVYRQRMLGAEPTAAEIGSHLLANWHAALGSEGNPFADGSATQGDPVHPSQRGQRLAPPPSFPEQKRGANDGNVDGTGDPGGNRLRRVREPSAVGRRIGASLLAIRYEPFQTLAVIVVLGGKHR